MEVNELLESLKVCEGNKERFYGTTLAVSKSQTRILVLLSFLFPGTFMEAVNAIELGRCQMLTDNIRTVYSVAGYCPSTTYLTCGCDEFARTIKTAEARDNKWKSLCFHLFACIILQKAYDFLPGPQTITLTSSELALRTRSYCLTYGG